MKSFHSRSETFNSYLILPHCKIRKIILADFARLYTSSVFIRYFVVFSCIKSVVAILIFQASKNEIFSSRIITNYISINIVRVLLKFGSIKALNSSTFNTAHVEHKHNTLESNTVTWDTSVKYGLLAVFRYVFFLIGTARVLQLRLGS